MRLAAEAIAINNDEATHIGKPILIVDDELAILLSLKRGLRADFSIDTAMDGEEAMNALRDRGPYAAIVCDLRMPKHNGLTVLSKAKEVSPATSRIMLTGDSAQLTAINAVNAVGVFRFLNKPCPVDMVRQNLYSAVHEYERMLENQCARALMLKDRFEAQIIKFYGAKHRQAIETAPVLVSQIQSNIAAALEGICHERRVQLSIRGDNPGFLLCNEDLLSAAIVALSSDMACRLKPGGRVLLFLDVQDPLEWSIDIADFGEVSAHYAAPEQLRLLTGARAVIQAHHGRVTRHDRPMGNMVVRIARGHAPAANAAYISAVSSL